MNRSYQLKETLVRIENVSLSYNGKPVLTNVNAEVRDIVRPDCLQGQVIAILGPSGVGKCLAPGTPILMFDGTIKPVERIAVGDQLMGPDSKPRTVRGLGSGTDEMYRIVPTKGDPFTCNSQHILALELCRSKRSRARHEEVTVTDYMAKSRTFKNRAKLYRAKCVEWPEQRVPLDPYFFGLWLGDGDADSPTITTLDFEVVEAIEEFAQAAGAETSRYAYGDHCPRYRLVSRKGSGKCNAVVLNAIRATGAFQNKHVPHGYKVNTPRVRRELLAGLMDSDGSVMHGCFDFISKYRGLAEDVCYLARSLGMAAYVRQCTKSAKPGHADVYHRVCISGDTDQIPTRVQRKQIAARRQIKNVRHVGFTVESLGRGEYYGFQIDGDGLFLLGDFTVTHNTQLSRILTGLQPPSAGKITVGALGKPIEAGVVGFVAQNYPLLRHRTVLSNLLIAAKRGGNTPEQCREKADKYLKRFELTDKWDVYPAQLSGGQRQRVAIAQQLLCSENYLVLDEPTTGLDPIMKDRVCDFIKTVATLAEENTVFVISHDIAAVLSIADTLWLLGRERDAAGNSLGANIRFTYDLIDRGIAWDEHPTRLPVYQDLVREIRDKFEVL